MHVRPCNSTDRLWGAQESWWTIDKKEAKGKTLARELLSVADLKGRLKKEDPSRRQREPSWGGNETVWAMAGGKGGLDKWGKQRGEEEIYTGHRTNCLGAAL